MALASIRNELLDLRRGIGQRQESFRFELINDDKDMLGEIHPQSRSISISNDTTSTVKRTLNGFNVPEHEWDDINPFADRVRPVMRLGDGTEWRLGVFYFVTDQINISSTVSQVSATLHDGNMLLEFESPYIFNAKDSEPVSSALERAAEDAGIVHYNLRRQERPVVSTPISWDHAMWIEIMTELCALGGFLPPHFDHQGVLQLIPLPSPGGDEIFRYGLETGNVVRDSIVVQENLLDAPNVHRVVSTGATEETIVAEATVPSHFPHSVEKRGFRVVELHREDGLETTRQAEEVAEMHAETSPNALLKISFATAIDPRHDNYDAVQWDGEMFWEESWSFNLSPGSQHEHTIVKNILESGE